MGKGLSLSPAMAGILGEIREKQGVAVCKLDSASSATGARGDVARLLKRGFIARVERGRYSVTASGLAAHEAVLAASAAGVDHGSRSCDSCKHWYGERTTFLPRNGKEYTWAQCDEFLKPGLITIELAYGETNIVETCGEFSCPQWEADK